MWITWSLSRIPWISPAVDPGIPIQKLASLVSTAGPFGLNSIPALNFLLTFCGSKFLPGNWFTESPSKSHFPFSIPPIAFCAALKFTLYFCLCPPIPFNFFVNPLYGRFSFCSPLQFTLACFIDFKYQFKNLNSPCSSIFHKIFNFQFFSPIRFNCSVGKILCCPGNCRLCLFWFWFPLSIFSNAGLLGLRWTALYSPWGYSSFAPVWCPASLVLNFGSRSSNLITAWFGFAPQLMF